MFGSGLKSNPHTGASGTSARRCDVAIVGAGPYGLATKAALRSSDLDVRLFGPPMSFWRERMPEHMLIRSPWVATSFAGAASGLTLDDYERSLGRALSRRLPLASFIDYGDWFQRRTSPEVDEAIRLVRHVFEIRTRTLSPDDPRTLDALEPLVTLLLRSREVASALELATALVKRRAQVYGVDAAETAQAREFLAAVQLEAKTQ